MKRFVAVVFAGALGAASYADVVYVNDFSTRTSKDNVPYGEWREVSYSTGTFLADDYPVTHMRYHKNLRIVTDRNTLKTPKFNV